MIMEEELDFTAEVPEETPEMDITPDDVPIEIGPSYEEPTSEETYASPSYEDLVDVGYGEEAAHEILETYPDKAQELYDVMAESNQVEAKCLSLLEGNEFATTESFFASPIPEIDDLNVSDAKIEALEERAQDIERGTHKKEISFGRKCCPTRHGCQGATDCDYSYGSYPF